MLVQPTEVGEHQETVLWRLNLAMIALDSLIKFSEKMGLLFSGTMSGCTLQEENQPHV